MVTTQSAKLTTVGKKRGGVGVGQARGNDHNMTKQGCRRFLKSGTAIERHGRSARADSPSRGRAREGDLPPSRKAGSGLLPRENF